MSVNGNRKAEVAAAAAPAAAPFALKVGPQPVDIAVLSAAILPPVVAVVSALLNCITVLLVVEVSEFLTIKA